MTIQSGRAQYVPLRAEGSSLSSFVVVGFRGLLFCVWRAALGERRFEEQAKVKDMSINTAAN